MKTTFQNIILTGEKVIEIQKQTPWHQCLEILHKVKVKVWFYTLTESYSSAFVQESNNELNDIVKVQSGIMGSYMHPRRWEWKKSSRNPQDNR